MKELALQIVRCVDDQHQPGWVECEFTDADGRRHILVDKIPIFTLDILDNSSKYPRPAGVACEIFDTRYDLLGRQLVSITIDRPYHVESTEKLAEFVVLATQLSEVCNK
jgi:hypothetical protein